MHTLKMHRQIFQRPDRHFRDPAYICTWADMQHWSKGDIPLKFYGLDTRKLIMFPRAGNIFVNEEMFDMERERERERE